MAEIPAALYRAVVAAADGAALAPGLCRLVYTAAGHPVANPRTLTRPDCEGLAYNMQALEPFQGDRFFVVGDGGQDVRELERATLSFVAVEAPAAQLGARHRLSELAV